MGPVGVVLLLFLACLLRWNHILDMSSAIHPSNLEFTAQSEALAQCELNDDTEIHPNNLEFTAQFEALLQAELNDGADFLSCDEPNAFDMVEEIVKINPVTARKWTTKPGCSNNTKLPCRQRRSLH